MIKYYRARTEDRGRTGLLIDRSNWEHYHVSCKPRERQSSGTLFGGYITKYVILPVKDHPGTDVYCDGCGKQIRYS